MRSGQGSYTFLNGDKYEGAFENDRFHGIGKITFTNGSTYSGKWENGKKNGLGVFHFVPSKDIYSGEWKDNYKHGKGTYIFEQTRMKVVGNWYKGQVQTGKWIFPNGTYFEGSFEANNPKGTGVWHFANGNTEEGEFCQSKVVNPDKIEETAVKLNWIKKEKPEELIKFNL